MTNNQQKPPPQGWTPRQALHFAHEQLPTPTDFRGEVRQSLMHERHDHLMSLLKLGELVATGFQVPIKDGALSNSVPAEWWRFLKLNVTEATAEGGGVALVGIRMKPKAIPEPPQLAPSTNRSAGRPSQGNTILKLYRKLRDSGGIDYEGTQKMVYGQIRKKTGEHAKGFGDEAIRKVISPLFQREKEQAKKP